MLTLTTNKRVITYMPGDRLNLKRNEKVVSISGSTEDMESILAILSECAW